MPPGGSIYEIRIHGRGGQGVMTVGQLLAQAYFSQGYDVQTFATYGGERRGTPVTAFVRVADRPIRRRCDVEHPHLAMLFEPTFLDDGTGLAGLLPGATVIINTVKEPEAFAGLGPYAIGTIDALSVARSHGLNRMVNTAMLGAFCCLNGDLQFEAMEAVVRSRMGAMAEANSQALRQAYLKTKRSGEVAARV